MWKYYLALDTWTNKEVVVELLDEYYHVMTDNNGKFRNGPSLKETTFKSRYKIIRELNKEERHKFWSQKLLH